MLENKTNKEVKTHSKRRKMTINNNNETVKQ